MKKFDLTINGKKVVVEVSEDTPLLWVLRDHLQLVGAKYGCGISQCGACTVHLNGNAVRSCSLPISAIQTGEIITIEGLSEDGSHPLQIAWQTIDVAQCGYCQAGQIMSAAALLNTNPTPSDQEIDQHMSGHICRCGTYKRIRKAIHEASKTSAI